MNNELEDKNDNDRAVDRKSKKRGSYLKGFFISFPIMIASLVMLGMSMLVTPEGLGRIAFYCLLGVMATTLISGNKELSIFKLLFLATGINILAIVIGFVMLVTGS